MKISFNQVVSPALKTAQNFLKLLKEMEETYNSKNHINKRWVYKDQEVIQKWISRLEGAKFAEDFNGIWNEVQNITQILGCTIDDELGERYRVLQSKFFEDMTNVIEHARNINE